MEFLKNDFLNVLETKVLQKKKRIIHMILTSSLGFFLGLSSSSLASLICGRVDLHSFKFPSCSNVLCLHEILL